MKMPRLSGACPSFATGAPRAGIGQSSRVAARGKPTYVFAVPKQRLRSVPNPLTTGSVAAPVDWLVSDKPVAYEAAVSLMDERVAAIVRGEARELVWLLEHPALYTAGTSARPADLLTPNRFPVHASGRGGQYTYHGPGQRIAYVMLDVKRRTGGDVRAFVTQLERWIIRALMAFGVEGETRADRVGVWVRRPELGPDREDKIAALGIRLRRGISLHGLSLNVEPDLEHFSGIIPCGISMHGVTSLADLGRIVRMEEVDMALATAFTEVFGPAQRIEPNRQIESTFG
jgi:lipoyl(octanoyl) transferase